MRAVASRLGGLRAQAESLMTLTLDWYEPTGGVTVVDGIEALAFTARGSTPGKLQRRANAGETPREVRVGGTTRPVLEDALHVPVDGLLPAEGWECVIAEADGPVDPSLTGRRFRVVGVPAKSFATARRLDVVEVS